MNKFYKVFSFLYLLVFSGTSFAGLFFDVSDESLRSKASGPAKKYRLVEADMPNLKALLYNASSQAFRGAAPILELPMPDGSTRTFTLEKNNTLSPEFAKKNPQIITFDGYDVDNPEDIVKIDITPLGFHAMIITPTHGTIYIDPISLKDHRYYKVFDKKKQEPGQRMICKVASRDQNLRAEMSYKQTTAGKFASCHLRTYRLAIAATAQYSAVFGGTKANTKAAQVTLMNRVNGIYQKDLGVTMTMIPNDSIIFLNAGTQPYTSGDAVAMLDENKATINSKIGLSNYDIGHVVDTGAGGIAGLGVVCGSSKAWGVTGTPSPFGDPFAVDYVAHEMGHQFGADHTFNNFCSGNRENAYAFEPGSGSTIMSYAGICSPNIQAHSDPYFHSKSLQEMGTFINAGGGSMCGTKTVIAAEPTIPVLPDIKIPKSTPFMLRGNASGIGSTNFTYTWEQIDNEITLQPPKANATGGPNFRSILGTKDKIRYIPKLASLKTGGPYTWEVIPSVGRIMDFRLTVRQNKAGGNCNNFDDIRVTVVPTAGPFVVTSFDSVDGIIWKIGAPKSITWSVANTAGPPISAGTVDILLSPNGGASFTIPLAINVANNGSRTIIVPNVPTNNARIMVRSHAQTFFDVTRRNIVIKP
jgi:hypothetical protein